MSVITFLGDVALLTDEMRVEYTISDHYVFNLECVITSHPVWPKKNKVNLYGLPTSFARVFGKNPTAVVLANNLAMDFSVRGYQDTAEFLNQDGIPYCGAGACDGNFNNPLVLKVQNKRLALMSYSLFNEHEGSFGVSCFSFEKAARDLARAKASHVHGVVVNIHWGEEESPRQTCEQQQVGRFLIEQGADLVIGHHPHCIQPFEVYRGQYIFYSLGNCVFPDISVPAFYDDDMLSHRTFRKKQLRHNKLSYAVQFDVARKQVVSVDKLFFDGLVLRQVGKVSLDYAAATMGPYQAALVKYMRKYIGFLWSNALVEGKLFDLRALQHEIEMKAKRRRR